MKKILALLIVITLFFSWTANADDITSGPVEKLGRGISNVVFSPLDFLKGMGDASEEGGIFAGLTWGPFLGTVNLVKRIAVGAFEIVTFPVPIPENYGPILTDPEFFLQPRDKDIHHD
ncbi:exosortase system-associated protein, TIGR04073 family [Candidatus Omnitrophota bacterium]